MPVKTSADAEDESDRKLLADIAAHGWHVVGVHGDEHGPGFAFSVGIHHTLGHPEILIIGLPHIVSAGLINNIGDEIRNGQLFMPGLRYTEIAEGFDLAFDTVHPSYFRDYLGYMGWFYQTPNLQVLQCLWPDKAGRFPNDAGYDGRYYDMQPLLKHPRTS